MQDILKALVNELLPKLTTLEIALAVLCLGQTFALYKFWHRLNILHDKWVKEYQTLALRSVRTINRLSTHLQLHHMQVISLLQARGVTIPVSLMSLPRLTDDETDADETAESKEGE